MLPFKSKEAINQSDSYRPQTSVGSVRAPAGDLSDLPGTQKPGMDAQKLHLDSGGSQGPSGRLVK